MTVRRRILFLLGQSPGTGSVLPGVNALLRQTGAETNVHVWEGHLPNLTGWDLVALRGLPVEALEQVNRLEQAGLRCCNSAAATLLVRDKAATVAFLAAAGIPVPGSIQVSNWVEAHRVAAGRPVVAKSVYGSRGDGVLLADREPLPGDPPFPGPYLIQDLVEGSGPDRKVYVVGEHVAGVLRPWPPDGLDQKRGVSFTPSEEERDLAVRSGVALGLEVYGVDFRSGPQGSVVVDVNAFPGFKGVHDAGPWLAAHLLAAVDVMQGSPL